MRLDHLLSTENAGRRSASGANPPARWSRVDGLLVWKMSLALPRRSCGGCGVVRMRFWAPGSPPQAFAWRDSMPVVPAGRPCAGLVGVAVRGGLRTG